eukprot:Mrub_04616.p1 GENE.Mrub_04616~~Mrub_04616.p1  ORF type:complete len:380 (-),score=59.46 Mrub_04616:104-1123(-)
MEQVSFINHDGSVNSLNITSDQELLIAGTEKGFLQIYSLNNECSFYQHHASNKISHSMVINALDSIITAEGYQIAFGSENSNVYLYSNKAGLLKTYDNSSPVYTLKFTPDHKYIITGAQDGIARVIDIKTGNIVMNYKIKQMASYNIAGIESYSLEPSNAIFSLDVFTDGMHMVTGHEDGSARMWANNKAYPVGIYSGHQAAILSITINKDQRYLLTASKDTTAHLYEINSFRHVVTYKGHNGWVTSIKITVCNNFVVTASNDMTSMLWNTYDGSVMKIYRGHHNTVRDISLWYKPERCNLSILNYDNDDDNKDEQYRLDLLSELVCENCKIEDNNLQS